MSEIDKFISHYLKEIALLCPKDNFEKESERATQIIKLLEHEDDIKDMIDLLSGIIETLKIDDTYITSIDKDRIKQLNKIKKGMNW